MTIDALSVLNRVPLGPELRVFFAQTTFIAVPAATFEFRKRSAQCVAFVVVTVLPSTKTLANNWLFTFADEALMTRFSVIVDTIPVLFIVTVLFAAPALLSNFKTFNTPST